MPQFLDRFPEVANGGGFYKGLMTAMIELGALIGALNQGWIADKLSRKYSIVLAAIIFIIGGVLQTAAVNYAMLTFARFFGGLGVGMLSMVAPLYISEISPPEIRGTLLVLEELSIVTGIVIAFWTTYGTLNISSEWSWRLPFLIQIFPAFVLGVGIVFLPFSPRWLCSKDRDDDALVALSTLRQLPVTDRRIQREWFDIRAEVALHAEISAEKHPQLQERTVGNRIKLEVVGWVDLFKKGCWRRTFVGSGLMFFQQVSNSNPCPVKHITNTECLVRGNQRTHLLFSYLVPDNGT
jgi:MFS family permease